MVQKNYRVINASAGSGKTYALVLNLLMICLRHPSQPDKIKNILALTFTNKAANEMKHRIISWLKEFSLPGYENNQELKNIQQKMLAQGQEVSLKVLHERSRKVLDYILHNYSTLNIGTIDKFNSRLVRSFAYELGLAQNFNLEINAEPYLVEAVEKMLEDIGEENEVSDAFMDFVTYSLDNNERVNINKTLYYSAKEFVQDKHYFRLSQNKDFDWKVYDDAKRKLRENIRNLKEENIKTAETCLKLLEEKNLETGDFSGGSKNSIAKFFTEAIRFFGNERIDFPFPKNEETALTTFQKGCSSTSKNRQTEILEILDFLLESRSKIISNYIDSQKQEKILHALLPLKVNKDIQDKLAEIEDKNDIVLLSKFNILIHENLRDEPSSFIYEKVGSQFSHYFFDEFQDTSFLQWQNFLPLRDHAVSSEEMSFTLVGDPKQSIYRFRGGDSQLMLDIINHREKSLVLADLENLGDNWRSAKNIVDFNNRLYQFLASHTQEQHCELFGKGSQQTPKSKSEGRVRINLIENADKNSFYEDIARKMQADIQQCADNGFRFSDITILCRGNFDIFNFSRLLGNLKIQYQGKEEFIKTISESGLTLNLSSTLLALTEFLRWEQNPKNNQFAVKMLYYLNDLGRIKINDFSAAMMQMLALRHKPAMLSFIKEHFGLNLSAESLLQLNLYNFVEHYLQEFAVDGKETDFLFNYLEMLYAFSQNSGANLKEFLRFWDEEAQDFTIQASDNLDAVKLMTIHKAKGLEFPVVFLPMENSHKDTSFSNWFEVPDGGSLASVNVKGFTKGLDVYDPDIEKFNSENVYQNKIDRFCLQYVATTRAAEQLFLYVQQGNKTSNNLELYDFIAPLIPQDENGEARDSFDIYETSPEILKKKKQEQAADWVTKSVPFKNIKPPYRDSIKIATPSKSYQNRVEKVRTGIFTHEILAKINTAADVEKTLEAYILEGTITQEEKRDIAERIYSIMNDENYAKYFTPGQVVLNEKDLMISAGGESKICRPDRLIDTGNGYLIIDFKTGEPLEKHQQQINEYRNMLERFGKKVLETTLIYI
ncbi:DNA helicase UvrD [Chryseobacterium sp. 6424]|uniref:UvrD-helicase domain-containing protein n=1 Tax=Chryseobacterium sp. 6424 TaxID=2039166 RepID=UPI000EFB38CB|nr:UvrD-helicase domain-containing protein [Chryseobacterium sp. 6424]AYO58479.1 DNA helicase UvrD [Chryseobacterium sp. 6424]